MIDCKTNYLKTLVGELCEKKDGDEILLDVFYIILDHYKKEGSLRASLPSPWSHPMVFVG